MCTPQVYKVPADAGAGSAVVTAGWVWAAAQAKPLRPLSSLFQPGACQPSREGGAQLQGQPRASHTCRFSPGCLEVLPLCQARQPRTPCPDLDVVHDPGSRVEGLRRWAACPLPPALKP